MYNYNSIYLFKMLALLVNISPTKEKKGGINKGYTRVA